MAAPSPPKRTEIVPFRAEHLDVVARFSAQVWQRPRSAAFLRWRYLEHPHHHAYLALRDGQCLAMVDAFRRPYRVGERSVVVSDSFDWYCLPELRRSGLGVRVLQRMMQDPEPVIVTGGSADTRDLLPRMRFQIPATRDALRAGARRRDRGRCARPPHPPAACARAPRLHAARPLLAPRVRGAPPGARVETPASLPEEALALDPRPGGRGSAPLWTPAYLAWLAAGSPASGRYVPLVFRIGEALAGWALLRVHEAPGRNAALARPARARARRGPLHVDGVGGRGARGPLRAPVCSPPAPRVLTSRAGSARTASGRSAAPRSTTGPATVRRSRRPSCSARTGATRRSSRIPRSAGTTDRRGHPAKRWNEG